MSLTARETTKMSDIHPSDEEALQTIDAAVFTGDPAIIRERLTYFLERWQRAFDEMDEQERRF
jgi:hypothetical protein